MTQQGSGLAARLPTSQKGWISDLEDLMRMPLAREARCFSLI